MKRYSTLFIVVGGLLLGTIAGLWLFRRTDFRPEPQTETLRNLSTASLGAQPPRIKGSDGARVTLEEFADFQCPPCARLHPVLKEIERDYGSRVRIVFRHYPLDMHQHAIEAAQVAEAAGRQGKFWEMHDLLYEKQAEWESAQDVRSIFAGYARSLGLDVEKFTRDIVAAQTREYIAADQQRGDSVDISGTPSLFLNNQELPASAMSAEGIRAAIDKSLGELTSN